MAVLALHNGFFVPKPLSYFIIPFYSFKTNDLAGYGKVLLNSIPRQFIRKATFSVEGTKFGAPGSQNYYKIKTGLELNFQNREMNNPFHQKIFGYYYAASDLSEIEQYKKAKINSYLQFGYNLENTSLINPFNVSSTMEWNKSYQKAWMDFYYRFSYNGKNKGLDVRFFAGSMLRSRFPLTRRISLTFIWSPLWGCTALAAPWTSTTGGLSLGVSGRTAVTAITPLV
jgi:hypothetical protein